MLAIALISMVISFSRSDMEYIIRISSNRLQFVKYEEKEKKVEIRN